LPRNDQRTAATSDIPPNPPSPRRAWAAGLGVLLLVAVCTGIGWLDDAPIMARPGGHPVGDPAWGRVFRWLLFAAFVLYVAGVWLLRRGGGVKAVAALACAVQLTPLAGPLLLSTDAWTYWDEGRIASVHDGNPYRDTPADFPRDPALAYVGTAWRHETTVYGPAFVLVSEPLARAAGESSDAAAWIYKTIGALAILGAAALAARLSPRPVFALALVGWNPILAIHLAGGGHNDAWLALLVLAALAAASSGHRSLAGAMWATGALVKWVPVLFLPLEVLAARRRRVPLGSLALGFGVVFGVIGGLATWRYGFAWLDVVRPLARNANHETAYALPHRLHLPVAIPVAVFVGGYLWLLRQAWDGRARLALASVLLLVTTPYLAVWYTAWALSLAAAEDDQTAQVAVLALCAYLLPQTIPA
jgi:Glycosyltransferase family 87